MTILRTMSIACVVATTASGAMASVLTNGGFDGDVGYSVQLEDCDTFGSGPGDAEVRPAGWDLPSCNAANAATNPFNPVDVNDADSNYGGQTLSGGSPIGYELGANLGLSFDGDTWLSLSYVPEEQQFAVNGDKLDGSTYNEISSRVSQNVSGLTDGASYELTFDAANFGVHVPADDGFPQFDAFGTGRLVFMFDDTVIGYSDYLNFGDGWTTTTLSDIVLPDTDGVFSIGIEEPVTGFYDDAQECGLDVSQYSSNVQTQSDYLANCSAYLSVDNVSLKETPVLSAIPVPATLPLLLAGFGGLVLLRHRRR